ncbi:SURF1 family protein [Vannielia sp.]|uniref:SURF1 family protein n=1 Tax=Vannielia sp. TaxID=2813045 RepID=UPI002625B9E3|nr:SURF1 family protein [Vannielia sp.]MDF1871422.1 SURF1 family protein [Vannielia sp.]
MRYLFPIILGVVGLAILVSLGTWQVQRMAWKEGVLAEIDSRISAAPVAVPAQPDPQADRFLPVEAKGLLGIQEITVLASIKQVGAVHRVISTLTTEDGRRLLVDLGTRPVDTPADARAETPVSVVGNLHWPDEIDGFTPEPEGRLFFARDIPAMAALLGTEPVLIVARQITPPPSGITPFPVSSTGIPNDHLEYAMTWFGLALVWLGMTLFLLWRIKRRTA